MAFVGLTYSLFSPIKSEPEYAKVEYDGEKAVVVGKMIGADVTFNRSSSKLHGDDAEIESDNSITGGTVTINVDDVEEEAEVVILGTKLATEDALAAEGEAIKVYQELGVASPNGGFGYVRTRRKKGVTSYQAIWIHKVQLGIGTENSATKAEQVSYQTPKLTGPIMAVFNDADKMPHFRDKARFANLADAIAWVNRKGGKTTAAAA